MAALPRIPIYEQSVEFSASDGFRLRGVLRRPAQPNDAKCAVVLNPGAAIAASRYRRFSRYLASHGIAVLTYDYRGIGTSKEGSIRNLQATIEDWSELDCTAAIGIVHREYKSLPIVGIGHSIGGLLFGGATNARCIDNYILICPHTGFVGDYRARYIIPMALLWHVAMPLVTKAVGYFPAHFLRLGEDIPGGVAMQWAGHLTPFDAATAKSHRSSRLDQFLEKCAGTTGVALLITFTDDGFATQAGEARLKRLFATLKTIEWNIHPKETGMRRIGHFGFFRRQAQEILWPRVLAYLSEVKSATATD